MAVLLITYDLNKGCGLYDGQNYPGVLKIIKEYQNTRLSESSYAIDTPKTPTEIFNEIKPAIDKNDNLYIIVLGSSRMGFANDDVRNWLKDHLH